MYDKKSLRRKLHEIIFEADTKAGKVFDLFLLILILLSVLVVMLDSVKEINDEIGDILYVMEWVFTSIFTLEYFFRIYAVKKHFKYIFSFYGIIDLLAVLPSYLSLLFIGSQYLIVIRALRLLRIFRVLKYTRYTRASNVLIVSLKASRFKIAVFFEVVIILVVILGSLMYLIEGSESGFTSIPRSIYWAIVTLTTVGYGDIAPATIAGQALASAIMIMGYAVIAVPTGIVTMEMFKHKDHPQNTQVCQNCTKSGHDDDAKYCKYCGHTL